MTLTRQRINELIESVNDRLTKPPDVECGPLPPLPLLPANTILGKHHIEFVRGSLAATCNEIAFESLPKLWRESVLQELTAALDDAWCDCLPPT